MFCLFVFVHRPCTVDNGHGHDAAIQSPVEQPPGAHDGRHRSAAAKRDARGRDVGVRKDAVQSAQSRLVRLQVPTVVRDTLAACAFCLVGCV